MDVMSVRSVVLAIIKPLPVSKPVLSTNVCNVRNVSSICQLIKIINVTKSVCSSNAINSVLCNSTCKPASKFVSDCHSVKPVSKLIDVNQKRPHEQLVTNMNNCQHDFTKPVSVINILAMSKYFYELVILFFTFHHNFCNNNVNNFFKSYVKYNNFSTNKLLTSNSFIYGEFNSAAIFNIPHINVLSSSICFYHFSFSSYEYSFFINSAFYNIFNVNSVTNILNNDFYITYLFDRNNRFSFCNYKVTGSA